MLTLTETLSTTGGSNFPQVRVIDRFSSVVDAILGALTLPDIGQLFPGKMFPFYAALYYTIFLVRQ
jgi:hypothetical protein